MLSKLLLLLYHSFLLIKNLIFRYGIYPLTAFSARQPPTPRPRAISPETAESVKSASPEPLDIESRKVVNMICSVKPVENSTELLVRVRKHLFNHLNPNNFTFISDDNTFTDGRQNESSTHMPDITRRYSDSLITRARAFRLYKRCKPP